MKQERFPFQEIKELMANFMSESARNDESNQTEWAKTIKQMSPIRGMQQKGKKKARRKIVLLLFIKTLKKKITATTLVCNNGIKWQPDTWQKMQRADEAKIQLKKNTYLLQKQQQ